MKARNKKIVTIVAIALCLMFANTAFSATGNIDLATRYQVIEGFGGSNVWSGVTLVVLANNNPAIYDVIFGDLGLDILRLRNTYGYDGGYIDRCAETIIEGRARTGRPLKIMVSSWAPPYYLKSNRATVGGDNATLAIDANDPNWPPYYYVYDRYAQWWYDSIVDYTNHNISPDYVSMQNEPDYDAAWDSCRFIANQDANIAGYSQAFQAFYTKLNTMADPPEIFAPEGAGMFGSRSYLDAFTSADKSNIHSYAYHLYNEEDIGTSETPDDYIPLMIDFAEDYNDKPRLQTEFAKEVDGGDVTSYNDAMNLAKLIHNNLYYCQSSGYIYWQLTYGAPQGLVSITSVNWTINPPYYAMKHYSAFTDPNWQRVEASTTSADLKITAFVNPDNTQLSAIILNTNATSSVSLDLSFSGFEVESGNVYRTTISQNCALVGTYDGSGSLTLEPNSITTLALSGTQAPVNCQQVQQFGLALDSDLNGDCYVDLEDVGIMTSYWLNTDCSESDNCHGADFEPTDGEVDFIDFSNFALQWLYCNDPQDGDCLL